MMPSKVYFLVVTCHRGVAEETHAVTAGKFTDNPNSSSSRLYAGSFHLYRDNVNSGFIEQIRLSKNLHNKGQISNRGLIADEPLSFGEHAFQYTKHTLDLVFVAFHSTGNWLGVIHYEPSILEVVWSLS